MALAAISVGGCGTDPLTEPTATAPSPFEGLQAGEYAGTSTLTSVDAPFGSNLECAGADISARLANGTISSEAVTLNVTQDSSDITARYASSSTGLACSYKGTSTLNTISADTSACDAPSLVVRCNDGEVRDLEIIGSTLTGTTASGTMTGTVTNTYNVFVSGGDGVGSLVLKYRYAVGR